MMVSLEMICELVRRKERLAQMMVQSMVRVNVTALMRE